jgi:ABC-type sulfate/molybdate transport systems ATPase subunit
LGDSCAGEDTGSVRGKLGKVLFSGDEVEKKVANLSGGEAARLIFARLDAEQPNVLVLDEPTNHLDLEAIEALVTALRAFDGTMIFVSHDRWFVSELASRVAEITTGGINDYQGSYEEYLAACGDDHLDVDRIALRPRRRKGRSKRQQARSDTDVKAAERRRRDLELRREVITVAIEQAEARSSDIDGRFCEPGFFDLTPEATVRAMQREQRGLRSEIDELMAEWELIETELEETAGNTLS